MPTAGCDPIGIIEAIRASRLAKAGLSGSYAFADCELGRRVLALVLSGRGAYLWGEPGRGKTYAAACAVRLHAGRSMSGPVSARIVGVPALLDALRSGYDTRGTMRPDVMGAAVRVPLLALDDLGAEHPTPWSMEVLTRLVDARVVAGLPTVVTSNYSVGEIRDLWGGMAGKRIASRLAGACERIEVGGPDRRLGDVL